MPSHNLHHKLTLFRTHRNNIMQLQFLLPRKSLFPLPPSPPLQRFNN